MGRERCGPVEPEVECFRSNEGGFHMTCNDKASGLVHLSMAEPVRTSVGAALFTLALGGVLFCAAHPADAADRTTKGAIAGAGVGLIAGGGSGAVKGALVGAGAGALSEKGDKEKTKDYATTGAVAGAGVGLLTGGVKGAAKGAIYGGATGAVIGGQKDRK